jgi:hypothetical protein
MSSINEQSILNVLKQLEFKKYDVEREDFIETLAKDMNQLLFPQTPKKKPGRKPKSSVTTASPAPAEAPAPAPATEEKPAKKKPGPKPKPKDAIKINAALAKKAKEIAGEAYDKKKLETYLNGLGKEVYDTKSFEEHVKEFYTKKEEEKVVEIDMQEQEFEGKTYLVDPATKRVYEEVNNVPVPVGYVGMGKFESLKVL